MHRKAFLKAISLLPIRVGNMKLQEFKNITDTFSSTAQMPVLFIGHGSPMNGIEDNQFSQSWRKMERK
jgi:4,5-DOPA dioxygenase extradiol